MAPKLEAVAQTLQEKVRVFSIDSDETPYALNQLQVRSLPTFIVFNKQGVEVGRQVGMTTEEHLISMVDKDGSSTPPYVWTQAGVEYLQSNGFHGPLGTPTAGSGATSEQLQIMAMEGEDVVQQAIEAGFLECPEDALEEIRKLEIKDIKEELIERYISSLECFDKEALVKSLYVARLNSPAENSTTEETTTAAPTIPDVPR